MEKKALDMMNLSKILITNFHKISRSMSFSPRLNLYIFSSSDFFPADNFANNLDTDQDRHNGDGVLKKLILN